MGIIRSECAYCEESGVDNECGQCGMAFHYDCARNRGDLLVKQESGGFLSSGPTHYRWACPNCGRRSNGTVR
jgi:predicted RNA-binding Zn-ribbon protein involved in translation (DUF1610 family)